MNMTVTDQLAEPKFLLGSYLFINLPAAATVPFGTMANTTDAGLLWSNGTTWQNTPPALTAMLLGTYTFATLPTTLTLSQEGTLAYTSDEGLCVWNGTSWGAIGTGGVGGSVSLTSPVGTIAIGNSPGTNITVDIASAYLNSIANILPGTFVFAGLPSATSNPNTIAITSDQGPVASFQGSWVPLYNVQAGNVRITTNTPLTPIVQGGTAQTTLAASGGTPPYTWTLVGAIAANTVSVSGGVLYVGTTTVETALCIVQVTDATGAAAQKTLAQQILASLSPANTPTFQPLGGTYSTAQVVSIFETTTGTTIYYTTNGSQPTTSSPVYTGPLTIGANTTIQAIAAGGGHTASSVGAATYVINATGYVNPIGINISSGAPLSQENFPIFKNLARCARLTLANSGLITGVTSAGWPNSNFTIVLWEGTNLPPWLPTASNGLPSMSAGYKSNTPGSTIIETITPSGCSITTPVYNSSTGYVTFNVYNVTGTFSLAFTGTNGGVTNIFCYLPSYPASVIDVVAAANAPFTNEAVTHYTQYAVIKSELWNNVWMNSTMAQGGSGSHPNILTASNFQLALGLNQIVNLTLTGTLPSVGATSATLNANFPGITGTYGVVFNNSPSQMRMCVLTNGQTSVTWTTPLTIAVTSTTISYATELYPYAWLLQFAIACNTSIYWNLPIAEDGTNYGAGTYSSDIVTQYAAAKISNSKWTGKLYLSIGNELWNLGTTYAPWVLHNQLTVLAGFAAGQTGDSQYLATRYNALATLIEGSTAASQFASGNIQIVAEYQTTTGGLTYQKDMLDYLTSNATPITFTAAPAAGATTASYPLPNGNFPNGTTFYIKFSDGTVKNVSVTTNSSQISTATWTGGLANAVTTAAQISLTTINSNTVPTTPIAPVASSVLAALSHAPYLEVTFPTSTSLALASAPAIGATSATLASAWQNGLGSSNDAGPWTVTFSDGESRVCTFPSNGGTTITWTSGGLTGSVTATATIALPTIAQLISAATNRASVQPFYSRSESLAILGMRWQIGLQTYESAADWGGLSNTANNPAIGQTYINSGFQAVMQVYYQNILNSGVTLVNHFHSGVSDETQAYSFVSPADSLALNYQTGVANPVNSSNSPILAALQTFMATFTPTRNYVSKGPGNATVISGLNYADNRVPTGGALTLANFSLLGGMPYSAAGSVVFLVNVAISGTYQISVTTTYTGTGVTNARSVLEVGNVANGPNRIAILVTITNSGSTPVTTVLGSAPLVKGANYVYIGEFGIQNGGDSTTPGLFTIQSITIQ